MQPCGFFLSYSTSHAICNLLLQLLVVVQLSLYTITLVFHYRYLLYLGRSIHILGSSIYIVRTKEDGNCVAFQLCVLHGFYGFYGCFAGSEPERCGAMGEGASGGLWIDNFAWVQ